ncbi:unnamed protein product [Rotaria magnacalcarata]|uniref:Uncharacterized protein n=1 Tax=Rotaria magnacalcarata TaxID=392030 RepID=A0A816MDG9_9BILA|nr:unnamed protein product [Rotaria magnacalcarata]CAF1992054.1 unnamed protein product [Rotaria magnacalcarata]CAF2026362.1 unnamed protein product [Rotaria magnacalcarata]CAF2057821.1 unnamed protein product [Rotaria magnacalcarata]CAF3789905.1 unnamed protein product [Rotaria magnacalcarata]
MPIGKNPPPIINQKQPEKTPISGQTAWIAAFKSIFKVANTRYAFLWLTGGILFAIFIKPVIKRRDEELMIEDVKHYLENKQRKDSA